MQIDDIIRISTDYGYGCWRITDIVCGNRQYVLYKSNNACVFGGWDKEGSELCRRYDARSVPNHFRHIVVEGVYGQWEQDDSVIRENLDLNNIDRHLLNQVIMIMMGEMVGNQIVVDSDVVLVKADDPIMRVNFKFVGVKI